MRKEIVFLHTFESVDNSPFPAQSYFPCFSNEQWMAVEYFQHCHVNPFFSLFFVITLLS